MGQPRVSIVPRTAKPSHWICIAVIPVAFLLVGCAYPSKPFENTGRSDEWLYEEIGYLWLVVPAVALGLMVPLVFLRGKRLGYSCVVSLSALLLLGISWCRSLSALEFVSIYWMRSESASMAESRNLTLVWGNGGIGMHFITTNFRPDAPAGSTRFKDKVYFRGVGGGTRLYPFALDLRVDEQPRPFPLSWGFHAVSTRDDTNTPVRGWSIVAPHWFVALVLSIPPALWLHRRSRRRRRGFPVVCGTVPPKAEPAGDAPAAQPCGEIRKSKRT